MKEGISGPQLAQLFTLHGVNEMDDLYRIRLSTVPNFRLMLDLIGSTQFNPKNKVPLEFSIIFGLMLIVSSNAINLYKLSLHTNLGKTKGDFSTRFKNRFIKVIFSRIPEHFHNNHCLRTMNTVTSTHYIEF